MSVIPSPGGGPKRAGPPLRPFRRMPPVKTARPVYDEAAMAAAVAEWNAIWAVESGAIRDRILAMPPNVRLGAVEGSRRELTPADVEAVHASINFLLDAPAPARPAELVVPVARSELPHPALIPVALPMKREWPFVIAAIVGIGALLFAVIVIFFVARL